MSKKPTTPVQRDAAPTTPPATPISQAFDRFAPIEALVGRRTSYRAQQFVQNAASFPPLDERFLEPARQRLRQIPDRCALNDQHAALWDACYTPASPAETRLFIALVLDGIPAAAAQTTAALIDAIVITLSGSPFDDPPGKHAFSCPVLMSAARALWAQSKFAPAPAEFLAAATAARERYLLALHLTNKLIDIRMDAEDVVETLGEPAAPLGDGDDIPF
jgi:hypothetical protein